MYGDLQTSYPQHVAREVIRCLVTVDCSPYHSPMWVVMYNIDRQRLGYHKHVYASCTHTCTCEQTPHTHTRTCTCTHYIHICTQRKKNLWLLCSRLTSEPVLGHLYATSRHKQILLGQDWW